jgi:hypothetical protein
MKPSHPVLFMGILAAFSLLVWQVVVASGEQDPTDNSTWYLGLFTLTIIASLSIPERPWRWAAAVIVPQLLIPFYPVATNIWPLSLMFLGSLFVALLLVAYSSAWLRKMSRRLRSRSYVASPIIDRTRSFVSVGLRKRV